MGFSLGLCFLGGGGRGHSKDLDMTYLTDLSLLSCYEGQNPIYNLCTADPGFILFRSAEPKAQGELL